MDPSIKLSKEMCPVTEEEKKEIRHKPYDELLGSLQFAANMTRPDIAFAVNLLSRFKENPGLQHWMAIKQIIRYLKRTIEQGIIYNGSDNTISTGYSDADWAGDQDDRKSSGYIMLMCDRLVSLASRKQDVNALSTLESEYIAAAAATQELIWFN